MAIILVTGELGGGKSCYGVKKLYEALTRGKIAVTNIDVCWDFPGRVAREQIIPRLTGKSDQWAASYTDRFHRIHTLDELMRIRQADRRSDGGVIVWDETHNDLNSRSWKADERGEIVKYFTQTRKLGFDVYLIAQIPDSIDKQVRGPAVHEVHCRNVKEARALGVRVIPFEYTFALTVWAHNKREVMRREGFRPKRYGRYFNTLALTHGLEEFPDDAIVLPHSRAATFDAGRQSISPVPDPLHGSYFPLGDQSVRSNDHAGGR